MIGATGWIWAVAVLVAGLVGISWFEDRIPAWLHVILIMGVVGCSSFAYDFGNCYGNPDYLYCGDNLKNYQVGFCESEGGIYGAPVPTTSITAFTCCFQKKGSSAYYCRTYDFEGDLIVER